MKNKGYTLLELLGVMIILATLTILVFPSIINFIKSSSEDKDSLTIDLIISATESFISDNSNEFNKIYGNTYCVSLSTLLENNYLNGSLKYDGENINDTKSIKVKYEEETIYELIDTNSCDEFVVSLTSNLVPVVYNETNWVVADTTKEWYNYDEQEWANAVILGSSVTKKVGDIVTVEGDSPDALAMFVWIPRYSYTIGNTYGVKLDGGATPSASKPGAIDIKFIGKNKKENGTAAYTGNTSNNWKTHPAFTFGTEELSGIWVGKFEVSHTSKTNSSMGCTTEECEEGNNLRVLPNSQALSGNIVSSFFYGIRSMSKNNNVFGIDNEIANTHMIKNNEWGAVVYLTQSKYGKYGNSLYEDANKEVYINNSSSYYTGRSGGSYGGNTAINTVYEDQESDEQYVETGFYTYDGYLLSYGSNTKTEERDMTKISSTTGNIYGVYDMSGGSWEYTMGVFANSEGHLWSGDSGFEGKTGEDATDVEGLEWPEEKYYQIFEASSGTTMDITTACNGSICYGEALTEIERWYNDAMNVVSTTVPWYLRGSAFWDGNVTSGIFSSANTKGQSSAGYSTRIVLTIN